MTDRATTPPWTHLEAVLFDLDGTLITIDHEATGRLAARLRPLLGLNADAVARWLLLQAEIPGTLLVTLLDILHLDEAMMGVTDKLRRRRGCYPAHEFRLIPGVAEMLLTLKTHYKLAIVTTRSRYHLNRFLERFPHLESVFTATCGLQDTYRFKPHPRPVQVTAARLGIPVKNCLMVGDTIADVAAARRAGAWSAAVLCGFGRQQELVRAGAHVILDTTADLLRFAP